MNLPLFFCYTCLIMSLFACDTTSNQHAANAVETLFPLTATEGEIQPGQNITFYYDCAHPDAQFTDSDELFLNIRLYTDSGMKQHRLSMRNLSETPKFVASFKIPSDSYHIYATLVPKYQFKSKENLNTPLVTNGQYVRGALPMLIASAPNIHNARRYFDEDTKLYPDEYERWCALILKHFRTGNTADSLAKDYAALTSKISTDQTTPEGIRQFDKLSAQIACAAFQLKIGQSSLHCNELLHFLSKNRNLNVASRQLTSLDALLFAFSHIRECYMSASDSNSSVEQGQNCKIVVEKLMEIASRLSHPWLITSMLAEINLAKQQSIKLISPEAWSNTFANVCETWDPIQTGYYRKSPGALFTIAFAMQQASVNGHLHFLDSSISLLSSMPTWEIDSTIGTVAFVPHDKTLRSVLIYSSRIAKRQESESAAIRYLYQALSTPIPSSSRGAGSVAARDCAHFYIAAGNLDSASKYVGIAEFLGSPFSGRLHSMLKELAQKQGRPVGSLQELSQMFADEFSNPADMVALTLNSHKKSFDLGSTGGEPVILMFSDEECSICREFMPDISMRIHASAPDSPVILLSSGAEEMVESLYGQHVYHVPLTQYLQSQFSISTLPAILVVVDGRVEYSNYGLGPKTAFGIVQKFYAR
jgi:hypothetical protein